MIFCRIAHVTRITLVCLAMSLGACDDPTAPLPREGPPDELTFTFGGFTMDAVTVELRGPTILMWRRPWNWRPDLGIDTLRATPTAEQWRAFWIAAERAGLRRWRSRYAANVVDGAGWHLRIVAGAFTLDAAGENAYPDVLGREHELEMTTAFLTLRTALGDLVGEPL